MSTLTWSDELVLKQPEMDATHHEFVAWLGELETVDLADLPAVSAVVDQFLQHTEAHFAQEEAWMSRIGFDAGNCHFQQHASVLKVLRDVKSRVDGGDVEMIRPLATVLAEWFVPHARNMDGGLAEVMALTGFDPLTGTMTRPPEPVA